MLQPSMPTDQADPVDQWDSPYIPHRFQEKQFRKYEPHIKEIVDSFPLIVTYTITGSTTTFACRLRDAMNSLSVHRWKTDINMERFDNIHPRNDVAKKLIKVSEIGHNVVRISPVANTVSLVQNSSIEQPKAKPTYPPNSVASSLANVNMQPVDFSVNSPQELELLCKLASSRLLTSPLIVVVEDTQQAIKLMESYDVLLSQHESHATTNKYILI